MSRVFISKKAALAICDYLEWSRNVEIKPALERTASVPLREWAELQRALLPKAKPSKSSSVCQWCGKGIFCEPCGPSHRMRKRLAEAKKRKAKKPAGTFGLRPGRYRSMKVASEQPTVADAVAALAYPKPGGDRKKTPDPAGMALAADLKARANATRRAFGLAPLPYPKMVGDREKALRKESMRKRRAEIRRKVFERAADGAVGGDWPRCEGPAFQDPVAGLRGQCGQVATDLSHLFGKGKGRLPESVRACAAWCRDCHKAFGANRPSAKAWWAFIAWWLRSRGFTAEANEAEKRAFFVEVRAALPSSPRATP